MTGILNPDPRYTKAFVRDLRAAWTQFDRLTAFGCAARRVPFDLGRCRAAWDAYHALIPLDAIGPAPIGL